MEWSDDKTMQLIKFYEGNEKVVIADIAHQLKATG